MARPFRGRRVDAQGDADCARLRNLRFGRELGLGALLLLLAPGAGRAASTASVAGVVRDAQGAAQVGAMVQVLATGSSAVATAFTDMYGRYRIANLVPGSYEVRATAALLMPATRWNLRLATGMRATVNLTMNMLADPAVWLPAERRKPDEPGDDWTWTLRSAAGRPILRVLQDGQVVLASAGDTAAGHGEPMKIHGGVMGGDAGFGEGGIHDVIALDRVPVSGADVVLQADLGVPVAGFAGVPSAEVDAGYERTGAFGNASRVVMSYASHPEMASAGNPGGMQWMRIASAERMHLERRGGRGGGRHGVCHPRRGLRSDHAALSARDAASG